MNHDVTSNENNTKGKVAEHPSPWLIVNDYAKTVVTLASALLAFSGTFSVSTRMVNTPLWPLLICWGFLLLAIATALFSVGRLTGLLLLDSPNDRQCIFAANVSYFALFAAMVFFVIFTASSASGKGSIPSSSTDPGKSPTAGLELVPANVQIPPFISASSTEPNSDLITAACNVRQKLQELNASVAVIIGGYDRQELSTKSKSTYGSNVALAQQRASRFKELLQGNGCSSNPISSALAVSRGPINTNLQKYESKSGEESALADDRRIEVYGLRITFRPPAQSK